MEHHEQGCCPRVGSYREPRASGAFPHPIAQEQGEQDRVADRSNKKPSMRGSTVVMRWPGANPWSQTPGEDVVQQLGMQGQSQEASL